MWQQIVVGMWHVELVGPEAEAKSSLGQGQGLELGAVVAREHLLRARLPGGETEGWRRAISCPK